MQKINIIVFSGVQNLPNFAAEEQGFFEKRGLSVETAFTKSSEQMRGGLADGTYDLALGAVDNAVAMVEDAHHDVVIVSGLDQSFNKLVVRPEISTYEDLRGKILGVDAPDTAFALIVYDMLARKGLKAGDYTVQPVGATGFRLEALKQGKIDFAMLNLPFNLFAQQAGLKILVNPVDVIGPYQSVGGFALRTWAAQHRAALVGFLAAYVEGVRWVLNPDNRAAASRLLQERMTLDDATTRDCIAQMLDPETGFAVDAKLNEAGMETLLGLRARFSNRPPVPASRYVDESFYREALAAAGA